MNRLSMLIIAALFAQACGGGGGGGDGGDGGDSPMEPPPPPPPPPMLSVGGGYTLSGQVPGNCSVAGAVTIDFNGVPLVVEHPPGNNRALMHGGGLDAVVSLASDGTFVFLSLGLPVAGLPSSEVFDGTFTETGFQAFLSFNTASATLGGCSFSGSFSGARNSGRNTIPG